MVSDVQTSSGGGAICENGTCTRLESMLAWPMRWTSVIESCMRRRRIEHHHIRTRPARLPDGTRRSRKVDAQAGAAEFVVQRGIRRGLAQVALDEQVHAAARAAGGDG